MFNKSPKDVFQIITDKIITLLEAGTIPWRKPWRSSTHLPVNLKSKKEYRGINIFMLLFAGYDCKYWVTFKQAVEMGGIVRKGEKGTPVIFWRWIEKENPSNPEKMSKIPFLRYYTVFNVLQCDNLEAKLPPVEEPVNEFNPIEAAKQIVDNMPMNPEITHGFNKAYYKRLTDEIGMPNPEAFTSAEEYYATLFHEISHATGHSSRLDRFKDDAAMTFGDENYSQEELVAEFSASFLCAEAGIEMSTIENSASYIKSWISKLKSDKKILINAAAQGQKSALFVLNNSTSAEEEDIADEEKVAA